jgi:hypothetical protein
MKKYLDIPPLGVITNISPSISINVHSIFISFGIYQTLHKRIPIAIPIKKAQKSLVVISSLFVSL